MELIDQTVDSPKLYKRDKSWKSWNKKTDKGGDVLVVLKSSDMSVDRIDDARKVLSQGDEIEVKLTNVDSKNRHIGVSIKAIAIDEERQAVRDHKKKEDVKSGSATIGDLIKAEMEKGEED